MEFLDLVVAAVQLAGTAVLAWGGAVTLAHLDILPASGRHMFDEAGPLGSMQLADFPPNVQKPPLDWGWLAEPLPR